MRGHSDSGVPMLQTEDSADEEVSCRNNGNFKQIVKFRAESGDKVLRQHLLNCPHNASYVSAESQRDLLESVSSLLQKEIVTDIKDQIGKFIYSVSADEVTDVSCTEQMALVIRFVDRGGNVKEHLLEYITLTSMTDSEVSKAILHCLTKHDIPIACCRAQTYDGASNMSGALKGCQAKIKELQPKAHYFHCASHRLNLTLNATSKIQAFRILIENVKQLGIFFKYSPKRQGILKSILAQRSDQSGPTKVHILLMSAVMAANSQLAKYFFDIQIKLLCETRWVERHTVMNDLLELYPYIMETLEVLQSAEHDSKTVTEASGLLTYLQSSRFLVSFMISTTMLSYTKTISQLLQGKLVSS